jgi:hypothetical protein
MGFESPLGLLVFNVLLYCTLVAFFSVVNLFDVGYKYVNYLLEDLENNFNKLVFTVNFLAYNFLYFS